MPLILPGNVGSATAATGYDVANSLRFNNGSSDRLTRTTTGSVTNADKVTFSAWVKRSGQINQNISIWGEYYDTNNRTEIGFNSTNDHFYIYGKDGGSTYVQVETNATFRDVSAWYHFVLAYDSTDGTAANRVKMYVNGVQITSFATATYPNQNTDIRLNSTNQGYSVGDAEAADHFWDGYMCEVAHVDGQQLAPTAFGEFDDDSGIWKPKDFKDDTTFGTNGYYLEFKQSGVGTNASGMGADTSGNDNHFAVNNLTAVDQSIDTCTNNFCTWNPLANYTNSVAFTEGNLLAMSGTNDQWDSGRATMGFAKGKWYFECLFVAGVSTQYIGVVDESCKMNTANAHDENGTTVFYNNSGGEIRKDGTATTADYGTFSSSEVAGIAIDADNFTISVYKGGSLIVDAYALSTTRTGFLFPFTTNLNDGDGVKVNFGSPHYAESGGNTDANGYGNFNQSVPSGYFAINTKNLAEHG